MASIKFMREFMKRWAEPAEALNLNNQPASSGRSSTQQLSSQNASNCS
jgi:hypothetical protein